MAKTDLVPIKVKLYRAPNGGANWPDWSLIPAAARGGDEMPPNKYIEVAGLGWSYDKISNLGNGGIHGTVLTAMPLDWVTEALALYGPSGTVTPGLVETVMEADAETFWDTRCHSKECEYDTDLNELIRILLKQFIEGKLAVTEDPIDVAAMHPDDDAPGVRRNKNKTWERRKAIDGFTIHVDYQKP